MRDPIRRHEDAVGDEAVLARTGRRRAEWYELLDAAGAAGWPHPRIARWLAEEHGVDGWWCQSLTVGFEQERGLRLPGQRPDGTFEASVSATLPLRAEDATAWCTEPERMARWLDPVPEVRGATEGRSVRWTWHDGTRVQVYITAQPDTATGPRCRVSVTHRGRTSADDVGPLKQAWKDRLAALREAATEPGAG